MKGTLATSILCSAVLLMTASSRGDELPESCKRFVETVDQCHLYDALVAGTGWSQVYHQTFDEDPAKLKDVSTTLTENGKLPADQLAKVLTKGADDKGTVAFDASNLGGALMKVGPTISGEFAVQIRGKVVSDLLCDLSIALDDGTAPGSFQFGGFVNSRNTLILGKDANGRIIKADGQVPARIVKNQWHTVRLEVTKTSIIGKVDGQTIVQGKPGKDYDFAAVRQPKIYIYSSKAIIDDFLVERRAEKTNEVDREKAWKEAFAAKTPDAVKADLVALTKLLDDPLYENRHAAHELLSRAGTLAKEPLLETIKSGQLEAHDRADTLLRALGVNVTPDPEEPPK
jgi:hypothetical protein